MIKNLNPQFETMFLLCVCPWGNAEKANVLQELAHIGIDGQEFYHKNFHMMEQYYNTFYKNMQPSAGYKLLHDMEGFLMAACAHMFLHNLNWFENPAAITDQAAQKAVAQVLQTEDIHTDGNLIESLESMGLADKAKWQIVVLQQKAGQYVRLMAQAVNENIPAFELAYKKVEREANALLKGFHQNLKAPQKLGLLRLPAQINANSDIIPTLALPVSVFITADTCFYGLLNNKLPVGNAELSKDDLLVCAKALSEKSKLEILMCLKTKNRYSLEIAEQVGLAPATVSHHMNALLASGFVDLEKREGKVYYHLAKEGIESYLTAIKKALLA